MERDDAVVGAICHSARSRGPGGAILADNPLRRPPMTTTPIAKRYCWEDFTVGRVMALGSTTVTREATLDFARQFDPQPFHLDDAAAGASLFGKLSASGWHTCAMTMRLMCDGYLNDSSSLGSPGIDELRWLKPVYPGDTLSAEMTVLEARVMNSKPHIGLVLSRWRVFNQEGTDVMTMQGWGMFGLRHPTVSTGT
jgi:acyl dehydratase